MAVQQLLASYGGGGGGGSDPNFSNVVALLHFDGTDGSTTFTDVIGNTWTAVNQAQLDTAQSRFGSASLLVDGTDDRATTPDSASWDFGSGDFTVECFIRPTGVTGTQTFISQWTAAQRAWIIYLSGARVDYALFTGAQQVRTGSVNVTAAVWTHIALSRSGTNIRLFVGGALSETYAIGAGSITNATSLLAIGTDSEGNTDFNGHIDEVRITKGVGRYTSAFSPPTAAFPDS